MLSDEDPMETEILTVYEEHKKILQEITKQLTQIKEIKSHTISMNRSIQNIENDVKEIKSILSQKVSLSKQK